MAKEVFNGIRADIDRINESLAEARDLISAMKEAGEDVSGMELELRELDRRKLRWEKMLIARGV